MSVFHQLALNFTPGVGDKTARALIEYFGDAQSVFEAGKSQLAAVDGLRSKSAQAILDREGFERAEQELEFIEKYKIEVLFFSEERYPKKLRNCYDAPILLYYKGNADLNSTRIVSIVGTRNATDYGREVCQQLISDLEENNVLIVSGLAYGIDGIAHKSCVKHQIPTVGVLGHGLDRIYPAQHRELAEKMLENGGLLTEFPSQTIPERQNFPKRNRIVAGMADVTIIVEASLKGGALITAELANSYNRDVFAFPGKVYDEFSGGCNYLIKTNRAALITGAKDLEYLLGWDDKKEKQAQKQLHLSFNLTKDEQKIIDHLIAKGSTGVDDLALATNFPLSKLAVTILGLEMHGLVISLPGKTYRLA